MRPKRRPTTPTAILSAGSVESGMMAGRQSEERVRGRWVLPGLGIVTAACSLFPKEADITSASLEGEGSTQLALGLDTCNADLSAEVDETEHEIVISVTARNDSPDDCADQLIVDLTEPLGTRSVVDASDGEDVSVEGRPG